MSLNHQYLQRLKIPVWVTRQVKTEVAEQSTEVLVKATEPAVSLAELSVQTFAPLKTANVVQERPSEIETMGSVDEHECTLCKLHVGCRQMIKGKGSEKAQLFVITEAPTSHEDLVGQPFAEGANNLFMKIIQAIGYAMDDVYVTPYVKCSPYQVFITPNEETLCYQHLKAELEDVKPQKILLLGRNVAKFFLNSRQSFEELRGGSLTFNELGYEIPVYVSYNPYQLLKFPEEKRKAWQDFKRLKPQ